MKEIEKIQEELKKMLSERRYLHSIGTMKMAQKLAIRYGVDEQTAIITGLLHDIGKEIPLEESKKYIAEKQIEIDEIEAENTALLHSKIGARIAKEKYGITEQMQNAIKYHTTGSPNMDILAKIIYVSDKTEETRNFEGIEELRNIAMDNLDKAVLAILDHDIKKNIDKQIIIHPDSVLTRNKILRDIKR